MAIWMDMTNSMHSWGGGVVGIIRAELEIAKNMRVADPDVHFFKFDGRSFVEIEQDSLTWLWESDSVGDAYLTAMKRKQTAGTIPVVAQAELREMYPGLDNALRFSSSRLLRLEWGLLLYCNTMPGWFRSALKGIIHGIFFFPKKVSFWRAHRKARKQEKLQVGVQAQNDERREKVSYPFADGDTVFSCGWIFSGKETAFEMVKQEVPALKLVYLMYDIVLIREDTKQYYPSALEFGFKAYFYWASMHCDALLFGGCTAMEDSQAYQKKHNLPSPPGYPVYFGANVVSKTEKADTHNYGAGIGITGDFIMAVGSLDERKNYSTLYRAMTILAERDSERCPQLVIVGKGNACRELMDTMMTDPRTKENIILAAPTDAELDWLYRHTTMVVLTSAWEGWSLTLPEALQYGKAVIVSDVPPLREIGKDFVVYADTYDPFDWAEKIARYMENPEERIQLERRVCEKYHPISWRDCGAQVAKHLHTIDSDVQENGPNLYMDITLSWANAVSGGKIGGILRTELMLIRHLYRLYPKLKFFSLSDAYGYQVIDVSALSELIVGESLDADYEQCRGKLAQYLGQNKTSEQLKQESTLNQKEAAYWFLTSIFSLDRQKRMILYGKRKKSLMKKQLNRTGVTPVGFHNDLNIPFCKGDVVFTAGTSSGETTYDMALRGKRQIQYLYCPVVYDYTPILLPQVHQKGTLKHYTPFLRFTSEMSDFIFYGGETARTDGIRYQREHGLPEPPSCAIRFGSDIAGREAPDEEEAQEALKALGIKGPFIMTVGTIEPRKNHETLYRAYLRMLEQYEDVPQLVFAGHPGWMTHDLVTTISRDERVKGKILLLSPSDRDLDILYRNCEFTVLASMYEGWSLTLPESYWYRKFCICCDTPALKETAGDLAEYIHAWDEKKWCERMYFYHAHPAERKKRESDIEEKWRPISWEACAEDVLGHLKELMNRARED